MVTASLAFQGSPHHDGDNEGPSSEGRRPVPREHCSGASHCDLQQSRDFLFCFIIFTSRITDSIYLNTK